MLLLISLFSLPTFIAELGTNCEHTAGGLPQFSNNSLSVNCTDLEDVDGFYTSKPKAKFFVAELNGNIVGCGGLRKSRFHVLLDFGLCYLSRIPRIVRFCV